MPRVLDRLLEVSGPELLKKLSDQELEVLAREIRQELVQTVMQTGGHLASNLGVVELTLALHRVFDSPRDRIVWDVGHQGYVHKLVTGRLARFHSLRSAGGISGFLSRDESPHDVFGAGHAGTSISAAVGMAVARDRVAGDWHVVAVIGDGGLTAGMAMEGLNHAGDIGRRLIVVLNDNGMSISANCGAVHRALQGIRRRMGKRASGGGLPARLWATLGFTYIGPVDGHDRKGTEAALEAAKQVDGPVLVHVLTQKGRGHGPSEADPVRLHGVSAPKVPRPNGPPAGPSYSQVFARTVGELMEQDPRVIAITAAMLEGTGLSALVDRFGDRIFDVGIAEQHAVTFAAGLATEGLVPVVAIYSTFLQRAYDQLIHDVCIQRLPVVFAIDRAGVVGDDGRTHQGIFDISYLRAIPNLVVMAPKDEAELRHMLHTAVRYAAEGKGPVAVRYPRGNGIGVSLEEPLTEIPIGRAEVVYPRPAAAAKEGPGRAERASATGGVAGAGPAAPAPGLEQAGLEAGFTDLDLTLVALGSMVHKAVSIAAALEAQGLRCAVVNARFVKPLDTELLRRIARRSQRILTLEEHVRAGGFGSAVLEWMAQENLIGAPGTPAVRVAGLPDQFPDHGKPSVVLEIAGLSEEQLTQAALEWIQATRSAQASAAGRPSTLWLASASGARSRRAPAAAVTPVPSPR